MAEHLFVIGPQRAGTTWLYELFLAQHHGVYLDRIEKENYFFSNLPDNVNETHRSNFLKKLTGSGRPELFVDVVSTYFGHSEVIEKILHLFPDAKFICVHRDEAARKKSFEAHREFNKFASVVLGYNISWKLYKRQSNFASNLKELRSLVSEGQILQLEFCDLTASNGSIWSEQINRFVDFDIEHIELGQVNRSRGGSSLPKRLFYTFVRFVQATRLHIWIKSHFVGRKVRLVPTHKNGRRHPKNMLD